MEAKQKLAYMIVKHLKNESASGEYSEDVCESLEVAIECLENCYKINAENSSGLDCGKTLMDLYSQATKAAESNKVKAEEFKTKGNDLMKSEKIQEAIDSYSEAITLDSSNAIYYSNRAAAYTKLGSYEKAISDCESAVKIDPNYSRAYGRMGLAYLNMQNYEKAKESCEKALSLDPTNTGYQANLKLINEKLNANKKEPESQPRQGGIPNLGGLDIGSLLSNPAVMNMAQSLMQSPQMQQMFSNIAGSGQGGEQGGAASANPSNPLGNMAGGLGGLGLNNVNLQDVIGASQQFAQELQSQNPDLAEELKSQFQGGKTDDKKDDQD